MHKVLPLLILIVLGGMVVYTITQPGANFSPNELAYELSKPPDPPLPKPSATGKATAPTPYGSPTPRAIPAPVPYIPTPIPTPISNCIPDASACESGRLCCGFCDKSTGNSVCTSLRDNICVPVGKYCRVGGKHCCNGECLSQFLGFGVCPSGWLPI